MKTLTPQGIEPTIDDIDDARAQLDRISGERRIQVAYALGTLTSVIEELGQRHIPCDITDCMVCWDLRHARAMCRAVSPFGGTR